MLLDTNVVSELMRPHPNGHVIHWLDEQPETHLFISAITRAEIETGITILPEGQRKQALQVAAKELLDTFTQRCYAFDCEVSTAYAEVLSLSRHSGRPMTTEDAQIAAIVLTYQLMLVTRNTQDFNFIPGISLINPWDEESV